MASSIVTARGRVTLGTEVLKHLGIQSGGRIRIDLLPVGRAELIADRPKSSWRQVYGMLERDGSGTRLSVEEINGDRSSRRRGGHASAYAAATGPAPRP